MQQPPYEPPPTWKPGDPPPPPPPRGPWGPPPARKPFSWKRFVIVTASGILGAFVGMMVATFGGLINGDSYSALNDRLGQGFGFGVAAAVAVALFATRRNR